MIEALIASALRSLVLATIVWLGLKAWRLRNPHIQLTVWTFVLVASLLMPAATRLAAVVIPPAPVIAPMVEDAFPLFAESHAPHEGAPTSAHSDERPPSMVADVAAPPAAGFSERLAFFASLAYGAVASVFLFRIITGLLLTLRLSRRAQPLRQSAAGYDIRVSPDVSSPVTFGRIILLPQDYAEWTGPKRLAVLAHEIAHARRGDFYVQIAALLNRAIFWFSPLSWWLQGRLSELAEAASDDAALAYIDDRALYAEILLEFSGGGPTHFAVAMARPATVRARIERILAESALPKLLSTRARMILLTAMLPIALIAASPLAARSPLADEKATAPAAPRLDAPIEAAHEAKRLDAPTAEAAPPSDATERSPTAVAPASQDAGETKAAASVGDARNLSSVDMASLTEPSATTTPILPQGEKDHSVAHISPQIEPKLPRPARSKTDSTTSSSSPAKPTETQPVRTSAHAAPGRPDICAKRNIDFDDASGQKGFYICPAFDREYAAVQPVGRR